jgi:hypothetical protein
MQWPPHQEIKLLTEDQKFNGPNLMNEIFSLTFVEPVIPGEQRETRNPGAFSSNEQKLGSYLVCTPY